MGDRQQWARGTFAGVVLKGLLLTFLACLPAAFPYRSAFAQTPPKADYRFQNIRNSSVGNPPALTDLGTNNFATAAVDGNTSRRVLRFAQGNGLRLAPTTGVVANAGYTIVMLFELDVVGGFRRIIDFKNGTSDTGLYIYNGALSFYPGVYGSTIIAANTYVQVALTRNAASKAVVGYLNGVQQFSFSDTSNRGVISASNVLRFFRDNQGDSGEHSAGAVARIRFYNKVLSASEIAALDRADFIVNSVGDGDDNSTSDGKCYAYTASGMEVCTLRAAIQQANANNGPNTINFGIPPSLGIRQNCNQTTKVCTIKPIGPLPPITAPVTIDGYTQGEDTPGTAADDARENTLANGTNAVLKIEWDGEKATAGNPNHGFVIAASNVTLRGLIINRWENNGVTIFGSSAQWNKVEGNFIGTDASGTVALGNGDAGVGLIGHNNTVGGVTPAARNLISGNGDDAIFLIALPSSAALGNRIQGNLIGTKAGGARALGNGGNGVYICCAVNTAIGGTSAAARNVIAYNGGAGVAITSGDSAGNRILANSIFANGALGIDLLRDGTAGVTANDPRDPDSGPNTLQNFPVLTSAVTSGTSTTIRGQINSTPNKDFLIQFFRTPAVDPTAYGEGDTYIGQMKVHTNAVGGASFTFHPATSVPAGRAVTSTATGPGGNTSEFSRARLVITPP